MVAIAAKQMDFENGEVNTFSFASAANLVKFKSRIYANLPFLYNISSAVCVCVCVAPFHYDKKKILCLKWDGSQRIYTHHHRTVVNCEIAVK